MPVTWDEKTMGTGVPQIDMQHKELIRRFNTFHEALAAGKGVTELKPTLDFMAQYAESHFRGEESLMTLHRCPAAAQNKAAHAEFRLSIADLARQVQEGGMTSAAAIKVERTLAQWLRSHICTVDTRLRDTTACQQRIAS